jgi:hypothetical protein
MRRRMERAETLFPQPDSPTIPRGSPPRPQLITYPINRLGHTVVGVEEGLQTLYVEYDVFHLNPSYGEGQKPLSDFPFLAHPREGVKLQVSAFNSHLFRVSSVS